MNEITLRAALPEDAVAIASIYSNYVKSGTATFEEIEPDAREIANRINKVQSGGYPWYVAIKNNAICGYAYANQYKERSAYRFTVESSVYIAPNQQRCGIGLALMKKIILRCTELGLREMMAFIGDSTNDVSISLHETLGFSHIGIARDIGIKFGRSIDVVIMQRSLRSSSKSE